MFPLDNLSFSPHYRLNSVRSYLFLTHPFQTLRPGDARDVLVEGSPEAQRLQPSRKRNPLDGLVKGETEVELEEGLGPPHLDHRLIEEHLIVGKANTKHETRSTKGTGTCFLCSPIRFDFERKLSSPVGNLRGSP